MTDRQPPTDIFFKNTDLTPETLRALVKDGLAGADYGEFYQEITASESLVKDKGEYTTISLGNSDGGFGFRVGQAERVGYSFSDIFNEKSLRHAIGEARQILDPAVAPFAQDNRAKGAEGRKGPDVMSALTLEEKISRIDAIEAYARSLDPAIANVTIGYSALEKSVHIVTAEGESLVDERPSANLSIEIMLKDAGGKLESGVVRIGGYMDAAELLDVEKCKKAVDRALRQARELLVAEEAPAGVMDVVLKSGWPGVILHEAVGHGLEGDFNRKSISVYSGKIGQQVATPEVTVIDRGDIVGERGSIRFDDEGTPTQENVLIENGVLKGYMQDRQNAQLMGVRATGNGRRQSYAHAPMPRMTNTYFKNGSHDPADIIKSVKDGLYIDDMGGGQVDITSGKFNMNARLAYRIRDGKLCEPVKGVTLVGDGLSVIQSITMVGNDLSIEKAAGMCGKNGQSVPAGCGQPTIRVSNMTVGGTKK